MLSRSSEDVLTMADQAESAGNTLVANQLRHSASLIGKYSGNTDQKTRQKLMKHTLLTKHKALIGGSDVNMKKLTNQLSKGNYGAVVDMISESNLSEEQSNALQDEVYRIEESSGQGLMDIVGELAAGETEQGLAGTHDAKQARAEDARKKEDGYRAALDTAQNTKILADAFGGGVLTVKGLVTKEGDSGDDGDKPKKKGEVDPP